MCAFYASFLLILFIKSHNIGMMKADNYTRRVEEKEKRGIMNL